MKCYCLPVACALFLASCLGMDANGQSSVAEAHVEAAWAMVSPKTSNAKPWQSFDVLFKLICTQPGASARPPKVGPGEPDEKEKLTATPRPVRPKAETLFATQAAFRSTRCLYTCRGK